MLQSIPDPGQILAADVAIALVVPLRRATPEDKENSIRNQTNPINHNQTLTLYPLWPGA